MSMASEGQVWGLNMRNTHSFGQAALRSFSGVVQSFSQKSRTATVPKVNQIGLSGVVDADLDHFWNCFSAGFLGERLYVASSPVDKFSEGIALRELLEQIHIVRIPCA